MGVVPRALRAVVLLAAVNLLASACLPSSGGGRMVRITRPSSYG